MNSPAFYAVLWTEDGTSSFQPTQFVQPPEPANLPRRRGRESAEQLAWRNQVLEALNRKRAAAEEHLSEPWWEPNGNLR